MPRPAPHRAPAARTEHLVQRYVLGAILLCTRSAACWATRCSDLASNRTFPSPAAGVCWAAPVQTFRTETIALFVGVVLTGFALPGGVWFLITAGWRWRRRL